MTPSALPVGEAHIWLATSDHAPAPALLDLLSDEERRRHARFAFEALRHQFLISHALVRHTLSRYAGADPAAWQFETNEYGCPFVSAPAEHTWLRFNLSHAKGLSAVIVARGTDVGVDVEHMERSADLDSLARRFFAPGEAARVRTARDFFTFWTLKESYIKARGMGLSLPLDGFAFEWGEGAATTIRFTEKIDDDPAQWRFLTLPSGPAHMLAAAVRSLAPVTVKIFPSGDCHPLK